MNDTNTEILRLGKNYKDIKLYFIKSFADFMFFTQNEEENKIIKLVEEIRLKLFDYLEPFMVIDAKDLINIIHKKYKLNGYIEIFNYIENIFNNNLYKILIEHIVKKRKIPDNTQNNYVDLLTINTTMYIGIIKIEILKIILVKSSYINDDTENLLDNLTKENKTLSDIYTKENIIKFKNVYCTFLNDMINNSKKNILKYYNDLRTNYSECKILINNCKELIIKNNILVKN